jgi:cytochrome c oxidase subunit 3
MSALPRSAAGFDARAWRSETATLGMWVFLATEVMFFGALFFGYLHVRLGDPVGFAAASRGTHPWLGTLNTAILLTSSLAMALATQAAAGGGRHAARRWLAVTALLGLAFVAVKGAEYTLEWDDGLVPGLHFLPHAHERTTQLFFYLYFVMTGVHAVHLLLGIGLVGLMAWKLREPVLPPGRIDAIDATALYWHFVDAVWIFLYPLFYLVDLHG